MSHWVSALGCLRCLTIAWLLSQCAEVACQAAECMRNNARSSYDVELPVYAFHGPVGVDSTALQDAIIHVLVKVKLQLGGSFLVRTVSYAERPNLKEGQEFAPAVHELDLFLEHRARAASPWQQLQLRSYGVWQQQGPFVNQAAVHANIAAQEIRLRVMDWPMYYTINLASLAQSNIAAGVQPGNATFRNAVVISDIHGTNTTLAAQVLATHMAYHMALGFDLYLVYVRGQGLTSALHGNIVTSGYIQKGQLVVLSLDALQIPQYDEGWADWAAYDPTKLVAYNHAALLLWGERFHLAVLDIDELWAPSNPLSNVNHWFDSCYPAADIISATRISVVCSDCLARGLPELLYFQQAWDALKPLEVLQNFSSVTAFDLDPKSVFDPDKVGQVWLHKPFAIPGSAVAEVVVTDDAELAESCVVVVHLLNLFRGRVQDVQPAAGRHHWLEHRHRTHLNGVGTQ